MNDLDEELGYDADHDDASQFCEHGNFIGSWWGPDYLCQWCEDGISVAEMRSIIMAARQREADEIERWADHALRVLREEATDHRKRARHLCVVVPYIADSDQARRYLNLTEES